MENFVANVTSNIIQFGLLIISLLTFYFMLKRDNRRANREIFEEKLAAIEKINDLDKRVRLLEQKVDLYDGSIRKELEDIKKILNELIKQFNNHLLSHN